MKTAVLIHGCHVETDLRACGIARDWYSLAVGTVSRLGGTGRITHGVILAYELRAERIIFGSGASDINGMSEAAYSKDYVYTHAKDLARHLSIAHADFIAWFEKRAVLDDKAKNTGEEIANAVVKTCALEDFDRLVLVSSSFHAPRCLALAVSAREVLKEEYPLEILVSPPRDGTGAPVIFEPPSRPDRAPVDWTAILPEIFRLSPEQQGRAAEEISRLLLAYRTGREAV